MGTRCDFYAGRGESAEWLGSVGYDGYPDGLGIPEILTADSEKVFRDLVACRLRARDDGTVPEQGWPWPWPNSRLTDWAYCWHDGEVWASNFGGPWFRPQRGEEEPKHPNDDGAESVYNLPDGEYDPCADGRRVEFPDMTARMRVAFPGTNRSGLMVFNLPEEGGEK